MKDWTPKELTLLGTMEDAALAKLIGRTYRAVRWRRQAQGIAPYRRHVVHWTDQMIGELGTGADAAVAARLGLSRICVARKRGELRIPAAPRKKQH